MGLRFNSYRVLACRDAETKAIAEAICNQIIVCSFLKTETACKVLHELFETHNITAVIELDGDYNDVGIFGKFDDLDEHAAAVLFWAAHPHDDYKHMITRIQMAEFAPELKIKAFNLLLEVVQQAAVHTVIEQFDNVFYSK